MALAEATVRVVLDVSRFDKELQAAVQKAADRAGRDFDREMSKNMRQAGRNATDSFRDAARTNMSRAGRDMARDFENGFTQGTSQMGGRVGQRIGNGLRTNISRAGITAGRGFADNMSRTVTREGETVGRNFATAVSKGMLARIKNAGQSAGRVLGSSATGEARKAGANVGREFSFSIGVGTLRGSRPLITAIAVTAGEIITQFAPALDIIAAAPPLFMAAAAGAGVLVAAFAGVGDAFKALGKGDLDKLDAAMEKLSPAARSFVREFASVRPELLSLKRDIQDAFFGQLQGEILDVSHAFTGPLRAGILGVASSLGQLVRGFTDTVSSAEGVKGLDKLFRGTSDFFDALRPGIRELTKGFLEFTGAAAPGLVSIGQALSNMLTRLGTWLSASAKSGQALQWIESGLQGLRNFGATLKDLGTIFGTIAGAARPLAFAFSGIFSLVSDLARLFSQLPGPIQTAVLAALLFTRTGLPDFMRKTVAAGSPLRTMLSSMAAGYRDASSKAVDYVRRQTDVVAVSAAITGASDRTVGGIQRVGGAFSKVAGPVAGAANALKKGFGAALSGLMGVLGGPWGLVLAGAGLALSVFSDQQQKAAEAAAKYAAGVRDIQATLNRTTGAVTLQTAEFAASDDRIRTAITTMGKYGVASEDVVQGALKQGAAHDRVEAALRRQAAGYTDAIKGNGDLATIMRATGLSQEDLNTALLGGSKELSALTGWQKQYSNSSNDTERSVGLLIDALLTQSSGLRDSRGGWIEFINQTKEAEQQQRLIAASMSPATREAQKLADAMGILADNTSDADAKAQAFTQIMDVLAGGTIPVQAAMAQFNEILQKVAGTTQDNIDKHKGWGAALVTSSGQINTATVNGNQLFNTYQQLSQGLSTSSAALVDNALKTGDVGGALTQVAANVQSARNAFIAQAQAMGIPQKQAEQLANAYGLIPKDVITKLALPAYENVRAQLVDVQNKIKDIPPDKFVNVGALTDEAKRRLQDIGFTVNTLPDGSVEVRANTAPAKNELSSLLSQWTNRVISWVVNIGAGHAMGDIVPKASGGIVKAYRQGGFHPRPMAANRAEIVKPKTFRLIGDRPKDDEAFIPINNSARSRMLLATTARRMDFDLVPRRTTITSAPSRTVTVGTVNVNAPYASPELVAKATINELARAAVG